MERAISFCSFDNPVVNAFAAGAALVWMLRQPLHPHGRGVQQISSAVGCERAKLRVPGPAIVDDPPLRRPEVALIAGQGRG